MQYEKSTTDLLYVLNKTSLDDLDNFLDQNNGNSISDFFSEYLHSHNLTPARIAKTCQGFIAKSYVYSLVNGEKTNPDRDKAILICLAAEMNLKETRRVLELFNLRPLYPKDDRDAIIAICINNKVFDVSDINERLFDYGLKTFDVAD